MKYPSLLALPFLALFTGCSSAKVVGTSTSELVTRTTRIETRLVGTLPSEGLPQLPEGPLGTGWTLGGAIELPANPSMLDPAASKRKGITLAPIPSGSFEVRAFPMPNWNLGLGIQANKDGASSVWLGFGRRFPIAKAVGMIRLGAGLHQMNATNTYGTHAELTVCPDRAPCVTEVVTDSFFQKEESTFSPFGRIIASIQPQRNGPWLDLQATTALQFAEWTAKQTQKVTVRRMRTEEDCDPGLIGPCILEEEWDETSESSNQSDPSRETLQTMSTGAGWTIRQGNQQWTAGARWYPLVGTVQASMQWSISFAGAGASR